MIAPLTATTSRGVAVGAVLVLATAGGVAALSLPASAASGGATAQAARIALGANSSALTVPLGLNVAASTPVVTAPGEPGTATTTTGLGLGAATVQVATNRAGRTANATSAQSTVSTASVRGLGSTLLSADVVESRVSCPSTGALSADTSVANVRIGGLSRNAAAGAEAVVPVTVAGLADARVTVSVSSPHGVTATSAEATGVRAALTLDATVPVVGTAVHVPLGTVDLATTRCSRPAATGGDAAAVTPAPAGGHGSHVTTGVTTGATTGAAEAPAVTAIAPDQGPTTGGQRVRVTGRGFDPDATTLTIGGNAATDVRVDAAGTTISATTPAGAAGPADVAVSQDSGTAVDRGGYTYVPPGAPTVSRIAPASGPAAGGQLVTVSGTGFAAGTTAVHFGDQAATEVTVLSADTLTARTPAHAPGTVAVTASNTRGASGRAPYTYLAGAGAAAPNVDCAATTNSASATPAGGSGGDGFGGAAAVAIAALGAVAGMTVLTAALRGRRLGLPLRP